MKAQVAVIMGSDSDMPVMSDALEILKKFKIPTEVQVVSAHRTPEYMAKYTKDAEKKGIQIIIAGAGGAAHLPGMVAAYTTLPVIGVPVKLDAMSGLDSLLSIAQMPKGVPVATMAVDNSFNAGLMAARILGIKSKKIKERLNEFRKSQKQRVWKANKKL